MYRVHKPNFLIVLIAILVIGGCQGNPTSPGTEGQPVQISGQAESTSGNRLNLGMYRIELDTENLTVDAIPVRTGDLHLNLARIFVNTMGLTLAVVPGESNPSIGLFAIDFTLTHPLGGFPEFSIFDVKGIVMAPGTYEVGIVMFSDHNETQLMNADGFAQWWNPTEFTAEGIFGYMPVFTNTTAENLTATINPYKYFADVLGPTELLDDLYGTPLDDDLGRGVFRDGSANTRRYLLRFPMTPGPEIVFGFAIDGCWDLPVPNPPAEVPDDFPIAANQPEAYNVEITPVVNTLYYDNSAGVGGGVVSFQLDVYDWQGRNAGTIAPQVNAAVVYSPDIFTVSGATTLVSDGATSARYITGLITDTTVTHSGETVVAARVGSEGGPWYDQGGPGPAPELIVSAWQAILLDVPDPECSGDANNDFGEAVAIGLDEGIEGQICLPDDYRDYFSFTIPAVYATSGSIDFYCDAEPTTIGIYNSSEELIYEESVSGSMASVTMDEVTLFPRDYYIRLFTSNDTQVAPYYLDMNIELVDVTPYAPVEITPDDLFCSPSRCFLHENYLIAIGYRGFWIYDITDTGNPGLVYFDLESYSSVTEFNWPYIYYGDYFGSPDNYDVSMIDLTTITSPVFHYSVITVGDNVEYITTNSEHLYMIYEISNDRHLGIYDWATNPAAPALLYSNTTPACDGFWKGLCLLNPETTSTRLLVWSETQVELWNVEDPTVAVVMLDDQTFTSNITEIKSNYSYFYVTDGDGVAATFTSCQISADAIVIKGSDSISLGPLATALAGDYAYVANNYGLDVVDISDINAPDRISILPLEAYGIHAYVEGDLLVLTPVYVGFDLFSIAYPHLPHLLYHTPVITNVKEIELFGDYALVADDDYNIYHYLKVVDISDPADPYTVEKVEVGYSIMSMEYYDGTAYVGVGWDLVTFNCTDPLNVSVYETIDLAENIAYFAVYRDTLYLADLG